MRKLKGLILSLKSFLKMRDCNIQSLIRHTKIQLLFLTMLLHFVSIGQSSKSTTQFLKYDSLVIVSYNDLRQEMNFNGEAMDTIIINGQATLHSEDALEIHKRLKQKTTYGESQAMTPTYDLNLYYYKNGVLKETVEISLWTNNLYSSYPLKVQRQGDCMCKGKRGFCCSEGGISLDFKIFILDLMEKYAIPVDKEAILNNGG